MDLPNSVQELAEVIGREKALRLIGGLPQCGKRSWRKVLYVPKPSRLGASHPLVRVLGYADALKLSEAFGGEILQPSNCNFIARNFRNTTIRTMAAKGMSPADIAEAVQITSRQVRNILKENAPEETATANDNTA